MNGHTYLSKSLLSATTKKNSSRAVFFLAGLSDAILLHQSVANFTGHSDCRAQKIKNNSNILSDVTSDKPCARQALTFSTNGTAISTHLA
jgi:hypothetical protein